MTRINIGKKYLYHATPSCNLQSIKEHGLGGRRGPRLWDYEDTAYEQLETGCFLAADKYRAYDFVESSDRFWELEEERLEKTGEGLDIKVFRIPVSALDPDLIQHDLNNGADEGDSYYYKGVIPYDALTDLTETIY